MKRFIILILIIPWNFFVSAQKDTVWLLNGEPLIISNYNLNIEDGILTYLNKHNKRKEIGLEYVFSVVDSNNKEKMIFESTTIGKTYFTKEEMRSFIKGEYAAHKSFHSPFSTISGIVTGAGSIYLFPWAFNLNIFFSPVIPATNAAVVGAFNYHEKKVKKKFPDKSDDAYFIAGYREVATQKRINNSIKGGIIGLGLGIASAIILKNVAK